MPRDSRTLDQRLFEAVENFTALQDPKNLQSLGLNLLRVVAEREPATRITRLAQKAVEALEGGSAAEFEEKLSDLCARTPMKGDHSEGEQLRGLLGLVLLHCGRLDELDLLGREMLGQMSGDAKLTVLEHLQSAADLTARFDPSGGD